MPEFSELQAKAEQLPNRIRSVSRKSEHGIGCVTYFKIPSLGAGASSVSNDLNTITKVAISLSEQNDDLFLRNCTRGQEHHHDDMQLEDYNELKTKILVGCYLFKWQQNNDAETHKFLIKLIKADLKVVDMNALGNEYIDACLDQFSKYCAFVYFNQNDLTYTELNKLLGDDIQLDINMVRQSRTTPKSMISDVFHTIGMTY